MSIKTYVCVLAGAAVVVAAALFGILGCEQKATSETKPATTTGTAPHPQRSPSPKRASREMAGPHTQTPTPIVR
jgi:hypothetical protein